MYAREALGDTRLLLQAGDGQPAAGRRCIKEFAAQVGQAVSSSRSWTTSLRRTAGSWGCRSTGKLFSRCAANSRSRLMRERLPRRDRRRIPLPVRGESPRARRCSAPDVRTAALFYAYQELQALRVSGDIGCYTLGAQRAAVDAWTPASAWARRSAALHGFNTARGEEQARTVAGRHRRLHVHPLGHHRA